MSSQQFLHQIIPNKQNPSKKLLGFLMLIDFVLFDKYALCFIVHSEHIKS